MSTHPFQALPNALRNLPSVDEDARLTAFVEHFLEHINARDLPGAHALVNALRQESLSNSLRVQAVDDYCSGILATEEYRWDQAERCFWRLAQQSADLSLQRRALNELGILNARLGRTADAIRYYSRALTAFEAVGDQLYIARTLKNLGISHMRAYDAAHASADAPQLALAYYMRALPIFQKLGRTLEEGRTFHEMGTACRALRRWPEALAHYQRTLRLHEQRADAHGQAITLLNLGETYQRMAQWAEAKTHFERAFALLNPDGDPYYRTDILGNLGRLACAQSQFTAAIAYFEQAIDLLEALRTTITAVESRLDFSGTVSRIYGEHVALLAGHARNSERAFWMAERAKSRAFVEMLLNQPIQPATPVPTTLLTAAEHLRAQIRERFETRVDVSELEEQLTEIWRQIGLYAREYASVNVVEPVTAAEVCAALPEGVALIEYCETPDQLIAFVITRQTLSAQPLALAPRELDSAFYHEGYLRGLGFDMAGRLHSPWLLAKLHERLIAPLAARLQNVSRLIIVPHGKLHYVPFHALWDQLRQSYLDEQWAVQVAPSAAVFFAYCQAKPLSPYTHTTAFGYSDGLLPQAELEALHIAQHMQGRAFIGQTVTRETVLREAAQARIVHLSCRGYFRSTTPLMSGLQLADGLLDMLDVFQHLRMQAELVTLSACDTRRGQALPGDELIGLTRAFMYAGTPAILASLWLVSDVSTRLLMEDFYQYLSVLPPWLALQRAQTTIRALSEEALYERLRDDGLQTHEIETCLAHLRHARGALPTTQQPFNHPHFWAPFVLLGGRL